MPGERIEAIHIEDIPEPAEIGPYRNIVIHTGINNIKDRNRRSNRGLGNILEDKCKSIMKVYPRSRIYLSLLLPTKLESLNYRVKEFNNILHDISHSYRNISIIDHPVDQLCNDRGCLKDNLGRHDKETGTPLTRDTLHLGKQGLRIFATIIKSSVMGKYKKRAQGQGEGQHRVPADQGTRDGVRAS